MGPQSQNSGGRPEPEPHAEAELGSERDNASSPPPSTEDLYNRLQTLSERLASIQYCDCPDECRGPDGVQISTASSPESSPSMPRAIRCRQVKWRSEARDLANVSAEAGASMEVRLQRIGGTGTLRISVQVHNDPHGKTTRKGVSNAFNFVGLLSVLLGGPCRLYSRAWVTGLLGQWEAAEPTLVSSPKIAERLIENDIVLRRSFPRIAGSTRGATHRVHGILANPKADCSEARPDQRVDQ